MRTLILEPELVYDLLEQRRRSGLDRLDEVWEGVLHLVPAPTGGHARIAHQLAELLGPAARAKGLVPTMHEFNVGASEYDFRIPDGGLHHEFTDRVWYETAALVVEIVSPHDESWEKLPFYAAHGVNEVLIIDPKQRTIDWLALTEGAYRPVERSGLIALGPAELAARIDWP